VPVGQYGARISYVRRPRKTGRAAGNGGLLGRPWSARTPPVQPPYANPPSRSSPACPGAWITPSSDTYSTTIKLLTRPPLPLTASPPGQLISAPAPAAQAGFRLHQGRNYRRRRRPGQEEDGQKNRQISAAVARSAANDQAEGSRSRACDPPGQPLISLRQVLRFRRAGRCRGSRPETPAVPVARGGPFLAQERAPLRLVQVPLATGRSLRPR